MKGMAKWVQFRYDSCPNFCYKCGRIGHGERTCTYKDNLNKKGSGPQYGVWMSATNQKTSTTKKTNIGVNEELNGNELNRGKDKLLVSKRDKEMGRTIQFKRLEGYRRGSVKEVIRERMRKNRVFNQ
ncbi:hypothetical protein ACH5RR_008617 [Cinchona calisaya]|uniref:CCHC-type domain-containing protein n=1 Tax=Cinchona calisaya TaxID=153742 RepID=A0ABD3ABV2_9GENT